MRFKNLVVALFLTLSSFQAYAQSGVTAVPTKIHQVVSFRTHGSYNFTVPPDVEVIDAYGCAGGAGGGGGEALVGGAGGAGGGSGQCNQAYSYPLAVTPGETLSITIGQGGLGASVGGVGNDGNTTYISGAHSRDGIPSLFPYLSGGKGGLPGVTSVGGTGGDGGGAINFGAGGIHGQVGGASTPVGGIVPGAGGAGGGDSSAPSGATGGSNPFWQVLSNSAFSPGGGGPGGNSLFGLGGYGPAAGVAGNSPPNGACGAGGSGAGANANGGDGSDGCIFLIFYSAYIVN